MDFESARQSMIDCQLATNNVISEKILEAVAKIPRESFLPENKKQVAYLDEDILIGEGRYLLEPMIFAKLLQAAEPKQSDVVLDVGGGSGYGSAVMSSLVQTVIMLEPVEILRQYALKIWHSLDILNIAEIKCEGLKTPTENGPYDIIFINGAVQKVPEFLMEQLKVDTGRLVCVIRKDLKSNGLATLIKRTSQGNISQTPLFDANIPYISELAPRDHFTF